jgi:hypothetical protein
MILVLALSCAPHTRPAHDPAACPLGEGARFGVSYYTPFPTPPTQVQLQFQHGWLAGQQLCRRALTVEDVRPYGWVVVLPDGTMGWSTDTFADLADFRRRTERCEVKWQGQVTYLDRVMIVAIDDERFTHRGLYDCTVGEPRGYAPGLL